MLTGFLRTIILFLVTTIVVRLMGKRQLAQAIAVKSESEDASAVTMKVGDAPKVIEIAFTPEDASNQRFRVTNTKQKSVVKVGDITETGFTLTPIGAGSANIAVTSVNGGKTATIAVTVSTAEA